MASRPVESRLARLYEGNQKLKELVWPGSDLALRMRVLSCDEVQEASAAATARFEALRLPLGQWTYDQFEDEVCTQLLHRACRGAEDPRQTFAVDADDLRKHTTVDQRAHMMSAYLDLCEEINPSPDQIGAADYAAIVEAVKKKDRSRLREIGASVLSSFLLSTGSPPAS